MHLIALALAHMEGLGSLKTASLLIRDPTRAALHRVLRRCPIGIKRVLKHLPPQVLRRQNYVALVDLLDTPESARVLHHATSINDLVIQDCGIAAVAAATAVVGCAGLATNPGRIEPEPSFPCLPRRQRQF
jgi:hypothetical protein